MKLTRPRAIGGIVVLAILVATAYVVSRPPGITGGPLQPSDNILGYGHHVAPGGVVSWVIQPRADESVSVTVIQLTLNEPTGGLELLGARVFRGPSNALFVTGYPPAATDPLIGTTLTFTATEDSPFIAIGLRAPNAVGKYSATGVWLDYTANGRHFRALLPWQMSLCTSTGEVCDTPDGMMFSFLPQ